MLKNKRKIIFITAIFVIILLEGGIAYAAYVSQGYQKAVVATIKKTIPFSSNYLKLMDESKNLTLEEVSPVLVTNGENDSIFEVTVNNFSLTNASQSANGYITYDITFEFEGDTTGCTINGESLEEQKKKVFTHTLQMGRHTNTYSLKIPNTAIGSLKIKTTVIPENTSKNIVSNKMLAATFVPSKSIEKVKFQCTGEFVDSQDDKNTTPPSEYSAFRYQVEITTGIGDIKLSWNPAYVELDPVFIQSLKAEKPTEANGYKTIEFVMDYSDISTYNMVFYRKKERSSTEVWQQTWEKLERSDIIKVEATEIQTDVNQR